MIPINWNQAEVKKDAGGIFLLVPLGDSKEKPMKLYVNEIFEEYLGGRVDLNLAPAKPHETAAAMTPEGRDFMQKLDLREAYANIREDLNTFTWIASKYKGLAGELAFQTMKPKTPKAFTQWQDQVRGKLKELLHVPFPAAPLAVEWGPEAVYDGLKWQKLYYTSQPGLKVSAVLAYPEGLDLSQKHPAVVCLHGHNLGKICTVGLEFSTSDSYYGRDLAKRGFVTLSLDQFGWGERFGIYRARMGNSEHSYALSLLLTGLNVAGVRAWDVSKGIDFLESLPFVDATRLATIGQSGGGTTSLFSSSTDPRVKAAVVSGYFCTFFDSIFSLNHCGCNFIPNIANYFDMADILGSRAPKPVFVVSGENDPIFPRQGVQKAREALESIYKMAGAPENFQVDILKGQGHMFSGRKAYPWLEGVLELK